VGFGPRPVCGKEAHQPASVARHLQEQLDYRIVLGGHTGPVIALHAVNGALVSMQTDQAPPVFLSGADSLVFHTKLSVIHATSLFIHAKFVSHPCQ